ncbi:hypothetical protein ACF0H5_013710 [Mactra antiquata]
MSDETSRILAAINSSTECLRSEIKELKDEIHDMKANLDSVKMTCRKVEKKTEELENCQQKTNSKIETLQSEIDTMRLENETLQLDVDAVAALFHEKLDKFIQLEDDFEKIERQNRRKNLRIFGLKMQENEPTSLHDNIMTNIITSAAPDSMLSKNDIEEAFRVGTGSDRYPPITIVKFKSMMAKQEILRGRDKLREHDIRISDDLTNSQRQKLADLKQKGKIGYFYKGELFFRTPREETTTRVFVNARRQGSNALHAISSQMETNQSTDTTESINIQ